jgi:hypothetical protein
VDEEKSEPKAKHAGKPSHKGKAVAAKPGPAGSVPPLAPAVPISKPAPPTPHELKPFPKLESL